MEITITQNMKQAISVIHGVGKWLEESGKKPSKWWKPENLNSEFLLKYAKSDEFYAALVDGEPAAAAILQLDQNSQDWQSVDKDKPRPALHIHWLCVDRKFAGMNLPKTITDFAEKLAKEKGINLLRVDTNAEEIKLRKIYEDLGFQLVTVEQEDYRKTAFYEKRIKL